MLEVKWQKEKKKFLQLAVLSALSCQQIQQNTVESTLCGTQTELFVDVAFWMQNGE